MKNSSFLFRFFLCFALSFVTFNTSLAQVVDAIKWSYDVKKIDDNKANIIITANIKDAWSLYSQNIPAGGPLPTVFEFESSPSYKVLGKTSEAPKPIVKYDEVFEMEIGVWHKTAKFTTQIEILKFANFKIPVDISYMVCNNENCVPFSDNIIVNINGSEFTDKITEVVEEDIVATEDIVVKNDTTVSESKEIVINDADIVKNEEKSKRSYWYVFWMGLIGGFLALMTPCVWPIIPMTVSFFLNKTQSKKTAIRDATFYGISIILVYILLGLSVSLIFGAEKLNMLATSPIFNLIFFALLVVFAVAFFGAFELTMPSKWVNAMDRKTEKSSGIIGTFFMALTLVLVSFSCTGPIVGALLVEAASTANFLSPLMGMLGFSIAIAIPFTLLAIFPSWLKTMPKSGGWLNSVKVVLAFFLLAFSLKFFVAADSVAGWNIMSRELFIAIWIVLLVLNGLYLLGKLKMYHDSEVKHITVGRLFLAIVSFSFALWMLPGMWGAPLKAISSFAPSMTTQSFDLSKRNTQTISTNTSIYEAYNVKEGAYGLMMFMDYYEGVEFSKKHNKPIFLDFSGIGCSNCKKMEASVWGDERVLNMLSNDFVIITLYTDDRTALPEDMQYISKTSGKDRKIKTYGQKWGDLQVSRYNVNAQPYYVLLDNNEQTLTNPKSFDTSVDSFIQFLKIGLDEYKKRQ